jgi:hypothetical protein
LLPPPSKKKGDEGFNTDFAAKSASLMAGFRNARFTITTDQWRVKVYFEVQPAGYTLKSVPICFLREKKTGEMSTAAKRPEKPGDHNV